MKFLIPDKGTDQSARMRRLVSAFVSMQQNHVSSRRGPFMSDVYYQIKIRHLFKIVTSSPVTPSPLFCFI